MRTLNSDDNELSLDPTDWSTFGDQAHGALSDMLNYLRDIRATKAWRPLPNDVRTRLCSAPPEHPLGVAAALEEFRQDILPYPTGNVHPRFWSWVCGTGSPIGIVADLLASGMNPLTLGFDDSAASQVELQVISWFKRLFELPEESSGLLVSGASMANLIAVAVGRTAQCDYDVRKLGMNPPGYPRLVAYASVETHSSVQKAVELAGIGSDYYRRIPVDDAYEIRIESLEAQIRRDRAAGLKPALLFGNAGTVNTGAIDPLSRLADVAAEYNLWFAVDGAFGAVAHLCTHPPANLSGMHRADAVAFDLHKWLHQPYNAGVIFIRNESLHRSTFQLSPAYLENLGEGLSAGPIDFSGLGVQLSRSFAALRVWLSFKTFGVGRFRALTAQNIAQARYLDVMVTQQNELEVMAPTSLNIVNYRYNPGGLGKRALDDLNKRLLIRLQGEGIAAPSSTRLNGHFSIRVCLCNHRTTRADLKLLVDETLRIGREEAAGPAP